jgi:hypothetical protein
VTAGDLTDASATARVLSWMRQHVRVLEELGGPDHVSGQNKAPYPHLRVAPEAGGSDRGLRWLLERELSLSVYGDVDGTLGPAELERLLYVALIAVAEAPAGPHLPGQAVITAVRSSTSARPLAVPLTSQPAWTATVMVSIHPPAA